MEIQYLVLNTLNGVNDDLRMTLMPPILLTLLFPWSLSVAKPCDTLYTQKNFKLSGHVNKTLSLSTPGQCTKECFARKGCHSINFDENQRLCDLNNANHLSNPESMVYSPGSQFINNHKRPPDKCSDKLCSEPLTCVIDKNGQSYNCVFCQEFKFVGCFKDTGSRALPHHLGNFNIKTCADESKKRNYTLFGVQYGGYCFSGRNAEQTYDKYGPATNCKDGLGGSWANDVYRFVIRDPVCSV